MSSIKSLIQSFVLMVTILIFAYLLPYIFIATELIDTEFALSGVYDVTPEWQGYDDGVFFIKLQYFIGYLLGFIGVGQFLWTATRREETQYIYYP